ncbi:MAG TPA: hypothetical protein VFO85_02175, partial [Vicinamibacteria bacterium]|nr:hypothetical protein [Vicinamibacteria bacterium]
MLKARRAGVLLPNLALAAASTAFVLALCEAAARWTERTPAEPLAAGYTRGDPLLGWRHRAGARVRSPNGDYVINSMG